MQHISKSKILNWAFLTLIICKDQTISVGGWKWHVSDLVDFHFIGCYWPMINKNNIGSLIFITVAMVTRAAILSLFKFHKKDDFVGLIFLRKTSIYQHTQIITLLWSFVGQINVTNNTWTKYQLRTRLRKVWRKSPFFGVIFGLNFTTFGHFLV